MLGTANLAYEKLQLSASLEDYLEAIYNLASGDGSVRSKDIAEKLGVARASVTGALRALKERGLAHYRPYGTVSLTEAGQSVAAEVAAKHRVLKSFFVDVLGVHVDAAQKAACQAEHALGSDIIGKLLSFVQFVDEVEINRRPLAGEFRQYCETRAAQDLGR
jgi:DtxR family transcriptional regulator, Mn-dependent transcriptional regulator